MKLYRGDKCLICGNRKEHPIHGDEPVGPTLLFKLLHIAWPKWMRYKVPENHKYKSDAEYKQAESDVAWLRKRLKARQRRRAAS